MEIWNQISVKSIVFDGNFKYLQDHYQFFDNLNLYTACPFDSLKNDFEYELIKNHSKIDTINGLSLSWELDQIFICMRTLEFLKY